MSRNFYDEKRSEELKNLGIRVVRFWDNDVLQNTDGVLEQIVGVLGDQFVKKPHPDPLLRGEGEERRFLLRGEGE